MDNNSPEHSLVLLDLTGSVDAHIQNALESQALTLTVVHSVDAACRSIAELTPHLIAVIAPADSNTIKLACERLLACRRPGYDRLVVICDGMNCEPEDAAELGIDDAISPPLCWSLFGKRLKLLSLRLAQWREHIYRATQDSGDHAANTEIKTSQITTVAQEDSIVMSDSHLHEAQQMLSRTLAQQPEGAVLLVQIRTLNSIFRSFGYIKGAKFLKRFRELLISCVRIEDSVVALHGSSADQSVVTQIAEADYVILLHSGEQGLALSKLSERIRRTIGDHVSVDGDAVPVVFSFGYARWPNDGDTADHILMTACKSIDGEITTSVPVDPAPARQRKMLADLYDAIAQRAIQVVFQPKVASGSGRLLGFEVLARWNRSGQFVPPDVFIPIAEANGLISQLGILVMEKALLQHQAWKENGYGEIPLAVNISPFQFDDGRLSDRLLQLCRDTRTDPSFIEIEITESSVLRHETATLRQLKILRDAGMRVALDDFGTGYSSLAHLQKLELDTLKIDRSFITKLNDPTEDPGLVVSVISIGISLGLSVVAEGIENAEQAEMLYEWGCHQLQGYYFSEPVDATQAQALISQAHLPAKIATQKQTGSNTA